MSSTPHTILVTGGAGFLGSHLCDRLLQQGHRVICLDNFVSGSALNIAHLSTHPNFRCIEQDVIAPIDVRVSQIFHLASPAAPLYFNRDPIGITKTSVLGTLNVLELAKRCGASVFFASTAEVYGDPLEHPQREDYRGNVNSIGPRACYDQGKRCGETLCYDYHRQHQIPVKIARIFNTYGPRMNPAEGRVIANFMQQALNNQPISLYGQGQQTRSFCFVDDMVTACLLFMATPPEITGPLNLGNDQEVSIASIAQTLIQLTGSGSTLEYLPLPKDDPRQRCPELSRTYATLDWRPTTDLVTGLQRTLALFNPSSTLRGP